jgi:hypothetical protein
MAIRNYSKINVTGVTKSRMMTSAGHLIDIIGNFSLKCSSEETTWRSFLVHVPAILYDLIYSS